MACSSLSMEPLGFTIAFSGPFKLMNLTGGERLKVRLVRGLIRLPSEVLESLGWRDGMVVGVEVDGDRLVIRPSVPTSCSGMVG